MKNFLLEILIFKMELKRNLRIITKNHAADPEIEFLAKSISKPEGCATAMPTAWELTLTRPIGLPPHAPVAQKTADQR